MKPLRTAAIALCLLALACGPGEGDAGPDAGGHFSRDAGASADSGESEDAGPTDAGHSEDAGTQDAGQSEDAGAFDAGTPVDDAFFEWPTGANNQAVLRGAALGDGSESMDDLRKELVVDAAVPPGYEVLGAFATRGSTSTSLTRVAIVLRNVSAPPRCYLRLEPITLESVSGTELAANARFLSGTVGVTSTGNETDTCLFAGDAAIAYLPSQTPYDELARVAFTLTGADGSDATRSPLRAVATSYEVSGHEVGVTIANRATSPVKLKSMLLVVLDAEGRPAYVDIALTASSQPIAAGASARFAEFLSWNGRGQRLLVLTSFATP